MQSTHKNRLGNIPSLFLFYIARKSRTFYHFIVWDFGIGKYQIGGERNEEKSNRRAPR